METNDAAQSLTLELLDGHDTDYLLVRAPALDRALAALRAAGHQIGDRGTGRRLSALPIPYPLAPIPSVQGACTTYAPTSMTEAAM